MNELPTWIPLAAALALALLLLLVLVRRRTARAAGASSADASAELSVEAALRRAERLGALPLDVLTARMRAWPGPLAEAVEAVRAGRFAEAKRMLEHPEVALGWSEWPEYGWALAAARRGIGSTPRALLAARQAAEIPGLEPRALVQAWTVVQELGGAPPDAARGVVLGIVVEMGDETVAAWADGEAELESAEAGSAAGPVRHPDVRGAAQELVRAAEAAADAFDPAPAPEGAVADGSVRYTLLTPEGARVAEAASTVARSQPAGRAALRLREVLREHTREVARIAVTLDEAILLNDQPTTLDALRGDLLRLRDTGGRVWLHRPNPHRDPSPTAHAVFAAVIEHGLPVTLSDSESPPSSL